VQDKLELFIPIRFVFTNKLDKDAKLLLAFDAFVLSKLLGREVGLGKIIHGDDRNTLNVKTGALVSEVRGLTEKIGDLLSSNSSPELILNRHCPQCEFQNQCRQKAIEKDDISLLSSITETERQGYRSKGIFTVTQLSYTFRPRRVPERAKNPATPHYFALQALAIREKTVYVHGAPRFPESKTQVYLDIEGLPDNQSYYLIGVLTVSEEKEIFHSFWADHESQEVDIFSQFVEAVCQWPDSRILHFGRYETVALKRMKARLPESLHAKIDAILERATNVLSVIHPHVYFPVYSNSLKDIGHFLGFEWALEGNWAPTRISAWPIASPNAAPIAESITLSVSNCHASRALVAPMAIRTAISFRRCVARAKSKLARFVHAISRTKSTVSISAPLNAITALRRFGSTNPGGVNRSDIPSSVFGYSCLSCRATVFNCARACSRFIPGFSRPKGSHWPLPRPSSPLPASIHSCIVLGTQNSGVNTLSVPVNSGGATPIAVKL